MSLADSKPATFSCLCLHIQDVPWEVYFSCPAWQTPYLTAHWVPLSQLGAMKKAQKSWCSLFWGPGLLCVLGLRLGCGRHKADGFASSAQCCCDPPSSSWPQTA